MYQPIVIMWAVAIAADIAIFATGVILTVRQRDSESSNYMGFSVIAAVGISLLTLLMASFNNLPKGM